MAQRALREASVTAEEMPEKIAEIELRIARRESDLPSIEGQLRVVLGLLSAFEGGSKDADMRLRQMPQAAEFEHDLKALEMSQQFIESVQRDLDLSIVMEDDHESKDRPFKLIRSLNRATHKRDRRLQQIRETLVRRADRLRAQSSGPLRADRHELAVAEGRLARARELLTRETPDSGVAAIQASLTWQRERLLSTGFPEEVLIAESPSAYDVMAHLHKTSRIGSGGQYNRSRMEPVTVIEGIVASLSLLDKFVDFVRTIRRSPAKEYRASAVLNNRELTITERGQVVARVAEGDLHLNEWDAVKFRALTERTRSLLGSILQHVCPSAGTLAKRGGQDQTNDGNAQARSLPRLWRDGSYVGTYAWRSAKRSLLPLRGVPRRLTPYASLAAGPVFWPGSGQRSGQTRKSGG